MAENTVSSKITSTLARAEDGNIQITFTIPFTDISKAKDEALVEIAKEVEIPGFRKGMAPVSEAAKKIPQAEIIEKGLGKILPKAFADAVEEYKIKPVVYPKFELIKSEENNNWEIRAITCELPEIKLPDYKKDILAASKVSAIWTPDKGKDVKTEKKALTHEDKEQLVIKTLLDSVKVAIPKVLVEEEVNNRLSGLLDRIEKLGLNLESYLSSVGKTPESLRGEYEIQAKNTITLDLVLERIAMEEKTEVKEAQIDEVIKAYGNDPKLSERMNTPEQRRMIASILRKRSVLEQLEALM